MIYETTGSYQIDRLDGSGEELLTTVFNDPAYAVWINGFRKADRDLYLETSRRREAELNGSFLEQWGASYSDVEADMRSEVEKAVRMVSTFLARLTNLRLATVTVTEDSSVFFQARHGNLHGYLEIHFGDDLPVEMLYNIYRNKAPISAFEGTVEQSLSHYLRVIRA